MDEINYVNNFNIMSEDHNYSSLTLSQTCFKKMSERSILGHFLLYGHIALSDIQYDPVSFPISFHLKNDVDDTYENE